jgi:hypothetical protein
MSIDLAFVFSAFITTLLLLSSLPVVAGNVAVLVTFVLTVRVDISHNPLKRIIERVLLNVSINIMALWGY